MGLVAIGAAAAEMANDVLNHDHGAVHHHAKIKGTERQQIGRDMPQIETNGSKQQGERDGERDNQTAPRTLPRNKKRMITTRMIPSVRLCRTVWVV